MLSWGRLRRALQPVLLKYWFNQRSSRTVTTRIEGFDLQIFPGVFHPKYFGSSSILARFVSRLALNGKSFLEVGCGSGVVALCAAKAGADVTAVDINPDAVRCTLLNAAKNNLRVNACVGDLFSAVNDRQFDVIVWNPPFLSGEPKSVAEAAFYGGRNFDVIRRFASEVRAHIRSGGSAYTIVSADVAIEQVEQIFGDQAFEITRVFSTRWGLGETMVILCAR
jgi:release factor glutamine methyltransferase